MSFVIKPDKIETENKTIRFPTNLISEIEGAIVNKEVTFSYPGDCDIWLIHRISSR